MAIRFPATVAYRNYKLGRNGLPVVCARRFDEHRERLRRAEPTFPVRVRHAQPNTMTLRCVDLGRDAISTTRFEWRDGLQCEGATMDRDVQLEAVRVLAPARDDAARALRTGI